MCCSFTAWNQQAGTQMDFFDKFPLLVVKMVFSHLKNVELLKATLINPLANKIISNSTVAMKTVRFKFVPQPPVWSTRKYSQFDFFMLERPTFFPNLPNHLTEVTFEECKVEGDLFHAFLRKISSTLELLIISDCEFYHEGSNYTFWDTRIPETSLQPI